jgi:sugar/nucleoside kinase (ribokinase family)
LRQDDMANMMRPCMPYLDYFMPNLEEGMMITNLTDPDEMCRYNLDASAKHVVLKMGEQGSLLLRSNGERIRVPAYEVNVVDTTGCVDVWSAGFIMGLLMNMTVVKAAELGSACGSLVASGVGSDSGIINLESTLSFIEIMPTLPLKDE